MKFLVDAQLPRRLARRLAEAGHDVVHTLDLPSGNRTTDTDIAALADRDGRAVVTKDADFVNSFVIANRPRCLVLVSVGNTSNDELERRLLRALDTIVDVLRGPGFVELTATGVVIHATET